MKDTLKADVIILEIAESYGYNLWDLTGKRKLKTLVKARQEAQYRIRNETELSLQEIGDKFHTGHDSVIHNIKKYESDNR